MQREFEDDQKQRQFNNLRIILAHEDIGKSLQYAYMYFIHFSGYSMKNEAAARDKIEDLSQPFINTVKLIRWLGYDHIYTTRALTARQITANVNKNRKEFDALGCKDWTPGHIVKFVNAYLMFMFDCKIVGDDGKYVIQHYLLGFTPFWKEYKVEKTGWREWMNLIQKPASKAIVGKCPAEYKKHLQYIILNVPNKSDIDIVYNEETDELK